ncbi:MAG: DUF58 domain-containing protein [Lachnospiraceae bacterium]|nr:DUF58 domain-containing protein [Lachnospiraceae bacterium]
MNYDYLDKIRAAISLYTRRRTSNILEGSFRSVYRGRSLEFDDLKEYVPGDDVHDIDWKSSSRTGKTLIRRYMAERRHNVLFIPDSGRGMLGHMPSGDVKWETALMTAGMIAYLMEGQGADFAFLYGSARGMEFSGFRTGKTHLETLLHGYRNIMQAYRQDQPPYTDLGKVMDRAAELDLRKKILVILTDRAGLGHMDEHRLRRLTVNNDLLVLCMEDVMLTGAFDGEQQGTSFAAWKKKPVTAAKAAGGAAATGAATAGAVTAGAGTATAAGLAPAGLQSVFTALRSFRERMLAGQTFDLDADRYEDAFVLAGKDLQAAERREREKTLAEARARLRRSRGAMAVVERESEILERTLDLFERYRHESYG